MIDCFCHWATRRYCAAALKAAVQPLPMLERAAALPVMTDLEERFRLMDLFPGYRQIPCLVSPPLEIIAGPDQTPELARLANDDMAGLAAAHPDRFPGFVASLPMNNPDAALAEARRAVAELGAAGVQIFTNVAGRALDRPEYLQLFGLMAELNRPVWLHPARGMQPPDYADETYSQYESWWALGWPYETSVAMYRLVFAGVFDRWPDVKIITHHGGGIIPMVEGRLGPGMETYGSRTPPELREKERTPLKTAPLQAFRKFYTDTATFGSAAAVACARSFFGADRLLFATDMPFGAKGVDQIAATLQAVDDLELPAAGHQGIMSGTIKRLVEPSADPSP